MNADELPTDQHGPLKAGVVFEHSRKPVVILSEPLYGPIPPVAHSNHMHFLTVNLAAGFLCWYEPHLGAYVDEARNKLVRKVLDDIPSATHILFIDQDVILPEEAVECLLSNNADIVSGTYFGKDPDATLVAFESIYPGKRLMDFDPDGVIQVAGVGMGCCLITTDLLRRMQTANGNDLWFKCEQREVASGVVRTSGEDAYFCRQCQQMGVPILLDGRVLCGHVMDGVVTYEHWKNAKDRKAATQAVSDAVVQSENS